MALKTEEVSFNFYFNFNNLNFKSHMWLVAGTLHNTRLHALLHREKGDHVCKISITQSQADLCSNPSWPLTGILILDK